MREVVGMDIPVQDDTEFQNSNSNQLSHRLSSAGHLIDSIGLAPIFGIQSLLRQRCSGMVMMTVPVLFYAQIPRRGGVHVARYIWSSGVHSQRLVMRMRMGMSIRYVVMV